MADLSTLALLGPYLAGLACWAAQREAQTHASWSALPVGDPALRVWLAVADPQGPHAVGLPAAWREELNALANQLAARRLADDWPDAAHAMHSYEAYLAACEPQRRRDRGVYFTPPEIVSWLVRAAHGVLQSDWELPLGLGTSHDPGGNPLAILDPAAGAGLFLAEIIRHAHRVRQAGPWRGLTPASCRRRWQTDVRQALADQWWGCELEPATWAIGQTLVCQTLGETGFHFAGDETLRLDRASGLAPRNDLPAAHVVLGNPPYSRVSRDDSAWGAELVRPFKDRVAGEPNQQPLSDDYVKFLAAADAQTQAAPRALVGLVTNHNWLDGVLFRGLREVLGERWPRVRLFDLHGHAGERPPPAAANGNLFGIAQGIALSLRWRNGPRSIPDPPPRIEHRELWGTVAEKRAALRADDPAAGWRTLAPQAPQFLFVPRRGPAHAEYASWPRLDEWFLDYSSGLMTVRDRLAVARSAEDLRERFLRFRDPRVPDAALAEEFHLKDYRHWRLAAARAAVRADPDWERRIEPILYRPFDVRWLYYSADLVSYPNWRIMDLLRGDTGNIALVASRLTKREPPAHVFATRRPAEIICLSPKSSNNAFVFPLRRGEGERWETNLAPAFAGGDPVQAFARLYAILQSEAFRHRYAAEWELGFPRVPPPGNACLDERLARWGQTLLDCHAPWNRAQPAPHHPRDCFGVPFAGGAVVGPPGARAIAPRYDPRRRTIDLAAGVHARDVPPEVWNFCVGGYQVCRSWCLAGRRTGASRLGRPMLEADLRDYQALLDSVAATLQARREIDACIAAAGGWPEAFMP